MQHMNTQSMTHGNWTRYSWKPQAHSQIAYGVSVYDTHAFTSQDTRVTLKTGLHSLVKSVILEHVSLG